jgi:hypothetical protein
MAIINKTGITDGAAIQAEHVTRAIDALSGGSTDTIVATGSFTGSFAGDGSSLTGVAATTATTASYVLNAVSASYALSASYEINYETSSSYAETASYVDTAQTASYVLNAVSSSYATTASYALNAGAGDGFPFTGSAVISGSLSITGTSTFTTSNVNIGSGTLSIIADTDSSINLGNAGKISGDGLVIPVFQTAEPQLGSMYFDSTGPDLYVYDGTGWKRVALV